MKAVVYGLLALLYVLHTDVWYWDDPRMLLGVPIGFTYHVLWTIVVTGAFWLAVRYAWPEELETAAEQATDRAGERAVQPQGGISGDTPDRDRGSGGSP